MTVFSAAGDLVADNLACRRGERLIFAGLSLIVPPGGAVVLTGANGSGKSSLLRLLATLLTPAAGQLLWGGAPVRDELPAYRARLHYVGHLDAIKPALSVRETLAFWTVARGVETTAIASALAAFGLDRAAGWPSGWLSAGQRQRLALSRLLASPAPLWLLDEPSATLDAEGEGQLDQAIAVHRAAGGRVVIATHQAITLPGASELRVSEFAASDAPAEF